MTRYRAHAVLVLALLFALSPLASDGFNGFSAQQFPIVQDHWPIQPAGWAFSIWGVIYGWLIAASLWGLRYARDVAGWQAMRKPLIMSLLIGTFWIAAANRAPVLATGMIIVMAASAIAGFLRAGGERPLFLVGPVGLYAGWLTAASGVAVVMSGYGVASAQTAALAILTVVLAVALWVQALRPAVWSYPLAVAGIAMANPARDNHPVLALACCGIVALAAQYAIRGRRQK